MLKAIKIRLYLNDEQKVYVNKLLGSSRFVYNQCLAYKIDQYQNHNNLVSFSNTGKYLTKLKNDDEFSWLKESHSKVLQQCLINLDIAYKSFFNNGNGFPKFKSKHNNQSCRFPVDAIGKIKGNRINIIRPLKNIHFNCSKRDEKMLNNYQHNIKSGTLSKTKSGNYYFSILLELKLDKTLPKPTTDIIGIDLGIKDFIVDSNGYKFENIKSTRNNEKKLKKLNQNLSRKKKGSKNQEKSRIKLAKYHEKLTNKKEYYLHSIVNQLLSENQTIVIEDLNISSMLKNKYLAKSIQELSLFRFKQILEYKAKWYGREIIQIDRWFPSSKLCNCCGYKNQKLELKDREWDCPSCGSKLDRDLNAAINILNEGKRIKNTEIKVSLDTDIGLSSPNLKSLESKSLGTR